MNIFDAMHRRFFDQLFSLDEEGREAKAKLLREAGVPKEQIAELTRPGIQAGMSFGGAKPVDVMNVVERVLFAQRAGSVLLRVQRPRSTRRATLRSKCWKSGLPPRGRATRTAARC
ncbi:MAG: hypothetical protein U0736_03815 [Gemmataceae bacterium]